MKKFSRFLLVAALTIPLLTTGCAVHAGVYAWAPTEQPYYVQWENQTHRQHMDWNQRSKADQKAYWKWRHHNHD